MTKIYYSTRKGFEQNAQFLSKDELQALKEKLGDEKFEEMWEAAKPTLDISVKDDLSGLGHFNASAEGIEGDKKIDTVGCIVGLMYLTTFALIIISLIHKYL